MANEGEPIPTGWAPLDRQCRRGGVPPGRVITIGGPPFAGKTTIVCQIAWSMARVLPVFALFADEGRTQAAIRLGLMAGVPVDQIEAHPAEAAIQVDQLTGERSLYLMKPDTEESTARGMVKKARSIATTGLPALLIFDSVQTIRIGEEVSEGNGRPADRRVTVENAMTFYRSLASDSGYTVLLTSRSNRASYRSRKTEDNSLAIASFAESGAVEYASDLALVLGSPDEAGLVRVEFVKNRLKGTMLPFAVKWDPTSGQLLEVDADSIQDAKAAATIERLKPTCDAIIKILASGQERSGAELERRLRGKGKGFGTSSVRAAIDSLVARQVVTELYREGRGGGVYYAIR